MPSPASRTPSGAKMGVRTLSESRPKTGCTMDEATE